MQDNTAYVILPLLPGTAIDKAGLFYDLKMNELGLRQCNTQGVVHIRHRFASVPPKVYIGCLKSISKSR